jgi:hypothetical protein
MNFKTVPKGMRDPTKYQPQRQMDGGHGSCAMKQEIFLRLDCYFAMNRENFDSSNEPKGHAFYPFSSHRLLEIRGVSKICLHYYAGKGSSVAKVGGRGTRNKIHARSFASSTINAAAQRFDVVASLKLRVCDARAVDRGLRF